jgi:hypothetical protein
VGLGTAELASTRGAALALLALVGLHVAARRVRA